MKTQPRIEDRDVVYVLAVRTRDRHFLKAIHEDSVGTGFAMLGRFCDGLGLEANLAQVKATREAGEKLRGALKAGIDGYQIFTPAEFEEIAAVIESIGARIEAAEQRRRAGVEKAQATRRAAKEAAVPA